MADPLFTQPTKCGTCGYFWMYPCMGDKPVCPCGGDLKVYDVAKEIAKLPYVPFMAEPSAKKVPR